MVIVAVVVVACFLLLVGATVVLMEIARRIGRRSVARHGDAVLEGFGSVETAILALLGLLLAFTFSAAAARFDARRTLIVQEANAIGTAYMRLDLLPPASQPSLRRLFGRYVDARLAIYGRLQQLRRPNPALADAAAVQAEIWRQAVAACRASGAPETMLAVLPPLNDMFDLAAARLAALRAHLPLLVLALLIVLILVCSVLAGYGMARVPRRSPAHMFAFAGILAVTAYVILDYEFPRFGLINLNAMDRLLTDLRGSMP